MGYDGRGCDGNDRAAVPGGVAPVSRGLRSRHQPLRGTGRGHHPAVDDGGYRPPAVALSLGARQPRQFNAKDLENGAPGKGLSAGVGPGLEGHWRLELSSDVDIEVLAYARSADGFLAAMDDPVPRLGRRHRVAIFNPASNTRQLSLLRLVNLEDGPASVSIEGVDAAGESPGTAVTVALPAGSARTLSAQQLEAGGAGMDGGLGDGRGKWRLTVRADRRILAMSLLSSPTGHLSNLSLASARGAGPPETAQDAFDALVSPVVQSKCVACHVQDGDAGRTRLVFEADGGTGLALNQQALEGERLDGLGEDAERGDAAGPRRE